MKGLLHSNDCLFIAHELLTLGLQVDSCHTYPTPCLLTHPLPSSPLPLFPQYRAVLKKQLGTPPLFVDLVPLFRQMAEEGCNRVLRHQHLHIKEVRRNRKGKGTHLHSSHPLSLTPSQSLRKGGEFVNTDDPTHYLEAHAAVNEVRRQEDDSTIHL